MPVRTLEKAASTSVSFRSFTQAVGSIAAAVFRARSAASGTAGSSRITLCA